MARPSRPSQYLGVTSVPLPLPPAAPPSEAHLVAVRELEERQRSKEQVQVRTSPMFANGKTCRRTPPSSVDSHRCQSQRQVCTHGISRQRPTVRVCAGLHPLRGFLSGHAVQCVLFDLQVASTTDDVMILTRSHDLLQALYPPFSVGLGPRPAAAEPAVTEVHLRRLDREGMLHRRAVAVISIDASPEQVGTLVLPGRLVH